MSARRTCVAVMMTMACASPIRAEDDEASYADDVHLRVDYGMGGSSAGLRGELGIGVAYSLLVASFQLGGATELFGGGVADLTGAAGVGFDLGSAMRLELLAELGTRSVHVDDSGLFGDGPSYHYASPHAGARLGLDLRLGSRNDQVHGRLGFVAFLRGDLASSSLQEDSYLDCGGGFDFFDDGDDCHNETFVRRSGGGIEGGVMLRLALDIPL